MRTNREFYLAIKELPSRYDGTKRSLDEYLRAILALAEPAKLQDSISLNQFFGFIDSAFTSTPIEFEDVWFEGFEENYDSLSGYAKWHALVVRQIVDLSEMKEAGILDNKHACFGVTSPRGNTWYNFHPFGYLECAAEGTFGGWQANDDGDRFALSPSAGQAPPEEIGPISWDHLSGFMHCGQIYE